jgi:spore coat polysaccharide biosynthesis protein SpsF
MTRGLVLAIIQARMGSTRLPGKTLLDLGGAPVMDRVVARVRAVPTVDEIVVATTVNPEDDVLAAHLAETRVSVFRGPSDDVLARFVSAAEPFDPAWIVRITADCPLIDPAVIDRVVRAAQDEPRVDYCSNVLKRSYPIGQDCEVIWMHTLCAAEREAHDPAEREHVTPFLYRNPKRFALRNVEAPAALNAPELRLTVDESGDLALVRAIVDRLGADADLGEILELLAGEPALLALNDGVLHRHVDKPERW